MALKTNFFYFINENDIDINFPHIYQKFTSLHFFSYNNNINTPTLVFLPLQLIKHWTPHQEKHHKPYI